MSFIIIGKTHGHNEETSIQFRERGACLPRAFHDTQPDMIWVYLWGLCLCKQKPVRESLREIERERGRIFERVYEREKE